MNPILIYVLIDRSGSTKHDFENRPIHPESDAPYIAFDHAFRSLCEFLCKPYVDRYGKTHDLRPMVKVLAYGYNDTVFPLLEHNSQLCETFIDPAIVSHCKLLENITGSTGFHLALERVHLDLELDRKNELSPICGLDFGKCLVINLTDGVFNPETQEKVRQAHQKLIIHQKVRLVNIHVTHPLLKGINIKDDDREFLREVSSTSPKTGIVNCYTDIPLNALAEYVINGTLTSIGVDYH